MAEQNTQNVVNQALSVGDFSPSDALATNTSKTSAGEDEVGEGFTSKNGENRDSTLDLHDTQVQSNQPDASSLTNGIPSRSESIDGESLPPSNISVRDTLTPDSHAAAGFLDNTGGSDTDISRADSIVPEDGKNQEQLNAVRRPASFKPISFAKFSVTKGPGAHPTGIGAADKGATSASSSATSLQQGTRPRLVAKTTSGLRNAGPKLRSGKNGSAGPDPMQVWNKNRPAPPPSTKHLTDEELKQQYGIHMTSRIQADGEGKEAKWADIDDDEDDWAPETIEWNDGTKVTLNHIDTIPPLGQAPKPEPADLRPKLAQPAKSMPIVTSSVGPNATVLRLGANAERQQAQKAAILHKGPVEKPIQLSTKAPAPAPTKSPWAPLPPVEKVSPIVINPQMAMPSSRYFASQSLGQSPSTMAMPSPAKEISADDFNRSWRESQTTQPRELYMPSSGRYETVTEGRRRGSRNDQQFRALALLQRPTQNDQHTPAEPSAAFQTHRTSTDQDRAQWTRRRASSTLSGGSGQIGRRMSLTKSSDVAMTTNEMLQHRRNSQITGPDGLGPPRDMPPMQASSQTYQARGPSPSYAALRPPGSTEAQIQAHASDHPPTVDLEAEREVQKRLMREKRELAIKRRQEEERRLEAEKRERIRLKLEAMGPPPEPKSKAQESAAVDRVPDPIKTAETPTITSPPPKPPIPEATGEPKQYGMMKVHHPDSIRKMNAPNEKQAEAGALLEPPSVPQPKSEPLPAAAKISPTLLGGTRPASDPPTQQQRQSPQELVPVSEQGSPSLINSAVGAEARQGWGGSRLDHRNQQPATLWGPPSNKQALGNGTFDQSLAGFPSRDLQSRNAPSYSQEAWSSGRPSISEHSPQLASLPKEALSDRPQPIPSSTSPEQRPLAADSEADSLRPVSKPAPIGPPQALLPGMRWQASPNMNNDTNGLAAWNNFPSVAAREDRAENERHQRELTCRLEEEARTGVRRAPQYTFDETWKQVEVGDQAGQRSMTGVSKASVAQPIPPIHQFGPVGSMLVLESHNRMLNGTHLRGSRFFPPGPDGFSGQNRRAITYSHPMIPRSPSPPPAEEFGSDHPAYSGTVLRPIVHFPPQKAIVKLPPRPPTPFPPAPLSYSAAVLTQPQPSLRQVFTPIAQTPTWQDRFMGLLGTKPAKKQALAVTSSSREPLEVQQIKVAASVSLPQKEDELLKDAGKVASKDVEDEEEIFEDREAGSLPSVRVPSRAPNAALHPAPVPNYWRYPRSDRYAMIDPISAKAFMVERWTEFRTHEPRELCALVRLPGSKKPNKYWLPRRGAPNVSGSPGSRASSIAAQKQTGSKNDRRGGMKSRDSLGTHPQVSLNSKKNADPSPAPNGNVPSPRSGFHGHRPNKTWSNRRVQSGVAH